MVCSALVLVTSAGGGVRESKRASDLSEVLGVDISPLQVRSAYKLLSRRLINQEC